MKHTKKRLIIYSVLLFFFLALLLAACSSILSGFQQVDPQSMTMTALITPTAVIPTLDLRGNKVLQNGACDPYQVTCISIFEDRPNGGIYAWAKGENLLAYVAPENRYWAWFSGDAVILDFSSGESIPTEMSTLDLNVFGDFAFSPDHKNLAFVALRQNEKLYTVMNASLDSELKVTTDLFPGSLAETDDYSSDKSVIDWMDNTHVRVSTSCGIDCEKIYLVDIISGTLAQEDEVRKTGHSGRTQDANVIVYDTRDYPAMNQPNWSPDQKYVFYTDAQYKTWILNDQDKEQFELPVDGGNVLQTLWSDDSKFIALRFDDKIQIFRLGCQ